MTFATSREAYDAYMGRYADRIAPHLIAFAGVQEADRVLDVGCVGPGGAYCSSLDAGGRAALREECRRQLGDPDGAFTLGATAWAVKGRV
ncbi:MAG: hypothetical protein M3R37_04050 [Actinomycetota bacterium]|nr:hypothetical protein [Actinomycetota bacterium]